MDADAISLPADLRDRLLDLLAPAGITCGTLRDTAVVGFIHPHTSVSQTSESKVFQCRRGRARVRIFACRASTNGAPLGGQMVV